MTVKSIFVPTQLFIHYLTNDLPDLGDQIEQLIQRARAGEYKLITHALVMVELVWMLDYVYHLSKEDIQHKVLAILNTPGFSIPDIDILFRACYLYTEKDWDFLDAYNHAWMETQGVGQYVHFQLQPTPLLEVMEITPGKLEPKPS
ncbi:MAG: hypothetical protein ACPL3P_07085 [Anaerolineales bacterium]